MRTERGQALTEYAILMLLFVIIFFMPWLPSPWPGLDPTTMPADPDSGERISIFFLLIKSFDIYINSFHSVITMPIP